VIKQYTYKHLTWYDLESPSKEEIDKIGNIFKIHNVVKDELKNPSLKPKVDSYDDYLYVILHFPVIRSQLKNLNKEIDFILGKDFIITTHYGVIDELDNSPDVFDTSKFHNIPDSKKHAGHLFYFILHSLYQSIIKDLEVVGNVLKKSEKNLFSGQEKGMLISLSKINRDLLDLKSATNLHKSVLESFEEESLDFYGQEFNVYCQSISNQYLKVHNYIQESKDFLEELRRTNDSLLSNKQNETMKILTIMAFVTFPLTLISSVFGMNTEHFPIVGHPNDFWIIVGIMASLASCFFIFFKYKRWL
jgi:magnesium transporter